MGLVDILGIRFFEGTFISSFILLLYVTSCQLVIPSCLLFVILYISFRVVRKYGADRLPAAGKWVLITGCDSGFGNALARVLDRRGLKVIATCLSETGVGARRLKEEGSGNMTVLQMDVSSDDSVEACLQKVKPLCQDAGLWSVVNNAGIDYKCYTELQPLSSYKEIAEVNLFGTVRVCKAFLPLIRKTKGRVVNVSSVLGLLALPKVSAYAITKFGVEGFSDTLRLEMRRFGVKVIIVEPGKYGRYTEVLAEDKIIHHTESHKILTDSTPSEVSAAYAGMVDIKGQVIHRDKSATEQDIKPVIEAFEDAILSSMPHARYLIDGVDAWIDDYCMMARLRNIMPACVMDPLVTRLLR